MRPAAAFLPPLLAGTLVAQTQFEMSLTSSSMVWSAQ